MAAAARHVGSEAGEGQLGDVTAPYHGARFDEGEGAVRGKDLDDLAAAREVSEWASAGR